VVTYPLWVQEVLGSTPGSGKGFYVWFCVLLLCFYFLSKNTLFIAKYCNSFHIVYLFSILNVLQDLWPIIRVKRYRPSIFKQWFQRHQNKKIYINYGKQWLMTKVTFWSATLSSMVDFSWYFFSPYLSLMWRLLKINGVFLSILRSCGGCFIQNAFALVLPISCNNWKYI